MGKFALLMYLSEFRLRDSWFLVRGNSKSNHVDVQGALEGWAFHDIATTNIVWCMHTQGGSGGGA